MQNASCSSEPPRSGGSQALCRQKALRPLDHSTTAALAFQILVSPDSSRSSGRQPPGIEIITGETSLVDMHQDEGRTGDHRRSQTARQSRTRVVLPPQIPGQGQRRQPAGVHPDFRPGLPSQPPSGRRRLSSMETTIGTPRPPGPPRRIQDCPGFPLFARGCGITPDSGWSPRRAVFPSFSTK